MFTAHLKQAQTLQRRVQTCELMWSQLEALATDRQIPERAIPALFDAVAGYRVRRTTSVAALEESGERISVQTASLTAIRADARAARSAKDLSDPFVDE